MAINKSTIIKRRLRQLGKRVTIMYEDGSQAEVYAVLNNTWSRNKTRFEAFSSMIGRYRNDYYVYIGPSDLDITALGENDYLICEDRRYKLVLSERVTTGNVLQYYTGILKRLQEDDGDVFI